MPICPNGHQSGTDDWCEVCGMRMAAAGAPGFGPGSAQSAPSSSSGASAPSSVSSSPSAPPSSPPPPGFGPSGGTGFGTGAYDGGGSSGVGQDGPGHRSDFGGSGYDGGEAAVAEVCPHCGTPREGTELFCEGCRYNFGTHSPSVPPAGAPGPGPAAGSGRPAHLPQPTSPGYPPYQRRESQSSRPSQINRPAEPVPSESLTLAAGSGDFLLEPPSSTTRRETASSTSTSVTSTPGSAQTAVPAQKAPEGSAGSAWIAVVGADREYFTAVMARSGPEAQGLYFPAYSPEVRLPLTGNQITIGRRRHSTGEAPDIDLSRSPEDPGVSHQHAVLVQQPDGSWAVVDQDSTNGTTVNLGEEPIRPYTPVPLAEGDRVHVGAWTTITVHRA